MHAASHPDNVDSGRNQALGCGAKTGWRGAAKQLVGLDLRSLAAFRIGLGLIILADISIRVTDLVAHYTDAGVLPRSELLKIASRPYRFSIHLAIGEAGPIAALFLIQAVVALLLLLGFRTRIMTVVSWLLLASLLNRNPVVLNAGDSLLALLLFWSMFLPLGARWSLDSRGRDTRGDPQPLVSMASLALIVQVCLVYVFTVIMKTDDRWWQGEALFYALHIDLFATRLGIWLRELQWPLTTLTRVSFFWEMLGPLLVFIPWRNGFFRSLAVIGFVAFHAGIGLTMNVGLFPLISIVGWIAIIPGGVWNWVAIRLSGTESKWQTNVRNWVAAGVRRIETRWPWIPATRPPRLRQSLLGSLVVTLALAYILAWNVRSVNFDRYERYFPGELNFVGYALRLDQKWDMFAPYPTTHDGWFVAEADLLNGEVVDLFRNGAPISWAKPAYVLGDIPNRRWGKYLMRIKQDNYARHRELFANYLTRTWNREQDYEHQLHHFRIFFMQEITTADGPLEPQKDMLWNQHTITPSKLPPPPATE